MTSTRALTFDLAKLRAATIAQYDEQLAKYDEILDPAARMAEQSRARDAWRKETEAAVRKLARSLKDTDDSTLSGWHAPYLPRAARDAHDIAQIQKRRDGVVAQRERALRLIDCLRVEDGAVTLTATQAREFLGVKLG